MSGLIYIHIKPSDLQTMWHNLTLNVPITTKVVCFCCLLKYFRSLFDKQCRPRSDCSCRTILIWVHIVYPYTYISQGSTVARGRVLDSRRVAGLSPIGVTVLCPFARHIYPCLVLVQPKKTRPNLTEKLLTGT